LQPILEGWVRSHAARRDDGDAAWAYFCTTLEARIRLGAASGRTPLLPAAAHAALMAAYQPPDGQRAAAHRAEAAAAGMSVEPWAREEERPRIQPRELFPASPQPRPLPSPPAAPPLDHPLPPAPPLRPPPSSRHMPPPPSQPLLLPLDHPPPPLQPLVLLLDPSPPPSQPSSVPLDPPPQPSQPSLPSLDPLPLSYQHEIDFEEGFFDEDIDIL